ncbi:hemerythrin domain-containing protein [Nocardia sp. NBC_00416]|uniref:hemerythrin domain-containing protein n=1 Tax=Nocardia sp. NBC_00416 TaxID=2975991 RepID=UPI002E239979
MVEADHDEPVSSGPPLDAGRQLVKAHDYLRRELAELGELIALVEMSVVNAGAVRSRLATLTRQQSSRVVGAHCAAYCRMLAGHHTREDRVIFPHLRRADPTLAPKIDRLVTEHRTVHETIEHLDRALLAFIATPDDITAVRAAFDLLAATLLDHLAYEESVLVEPLARFGLGTA